MPKGVNLGPFFHKPQGLIQKLDAVYKRAKTVLLGLILGRLTTCADHTLASGQM